MFFLFCLCVSTFFVKQVGFCCLEQKKREFWLCHKFCEYENKTKENDTNDVAKWYYSSQIQKDDDVNGWIKGQFAQDVYIYFFLDAAYTFLCDCLFVFIKCSLLLFLVLLCHQIKEALIPVLLYIPSPTLCYLSFRCTFFYCSVIIIFHRSQMYKHTV